ncbi:unnamed protein product [Litomosoides sigmodontis]|uniref:tRNA-dihydrouridine(47) synthase [NAD(P)(+)] n=1 Tax=Litomosoides sigmodontis TaxID=42156 RepID=A0A3P6TVD0_LITSI|nr:unnamed protein product [Litomosoides sigmodontis]
MGFTSHLTSGGGCPDKEHNHPAYAPIKKEYISGDRYSPKISCGNCDAGNVERPRRKSRGINRERGKEMAKNLIKALIEERKASIQMLRFLDLCGVCTNLLSHNLADVQKPFIALSIALLLINMSCEDYRDRLKKRQGWSAVSHVLIHDYENKDLVERQCIEKEVQNKWRNMRDCYIRDVQRKNGEMVKSRGKRTRQYIRGRIANIPGEQIAAKTHSQPMTLQPENLDIHFNNFSKLALVLVASFLAQISLLYTFKMLNDHESLWNIHRECSTTWISSLASFSCSAVARANARQQLPRLCSSTILGKPCKYAKKCTSLHSVDEYLVVKPSDIGPVCYNFDQRGTCPFSFACRFANAHTSSDGKQLTKSPCALYRQTLNANFLPLQIVLRKRNYDFGKSDQAVAELLQTTGCMEREKLKIDMRVLSRKLYLAPLTTLGNLPFRRLCVDFGAEITCSEMGVCTAYLSGASTEWSLLKRHPSEKYFGVQLAGGYPDSMSRAAQVIAENGQVDFIDINCGCPIDLINEKGGGCTLASRSNKLVEVMKAVSKVIGNVPLTVKLRTGTKENVYTAHKTIEKMVECCPPQLITLHPRSKAQRYTKLADWSYTRQCSEASQNLPFWACGDVLSYTDYHEKLETYPVDGVMIGRGALMKPWIFTEIQERRHWDISATERLDCVQKFVNYGLEHWGSDDEGVEKTRRFLLEWLSFAHRYIPVGLLEVVPQRMNERPPFYHGRSDLETLLASDRSEDWIKISEMFLGKVPENFLFIPKHNANAYSMSDTSGMRIV